MTIKRTLCLVIALLGLSVGAVAQTVTSTVTGRVLDPKLAVVPGADIVLTNTETALIRHAVSDAIGEYLLLSIPPGKYSVTVSKEPDFAAATVQIDVIPASRLPAAGSRVWMKRPANSKATSTCRATPTSAPGSAWPTVWGTRRCCVPASVSFTTVFSTTPFPARLRIR